jgi:hypothetical protein
LFWPNRSLTTFMLSIIGLDHYAAVAPLGLDFASHLFGVRHDVHFSMHQRVGQLART